MSTESTDFINSTNVNMSMTYYEDEDEEATRSKKLKFPKDINDIRVHNMNTTELWMLSLVLEDTVVISEKTYYDYGWYGWCYFHLDKQIYRIKYYAEFGRAHAKVYYIKKHK